MILIPFRQKYRKVSWIFSLYSPVDPGLCPGERFSITT